MPYQDLPYPTLTIDQIKSVLQVYGQAYRKEALTI